MKSPAFGINFFGVRGVRDFLLSRFSSPGARFFSKGPILLLQGVCKKSRLQREVFVATISITSDVVLVWSVILFINFQYFLSGLKGMRFQFRLWPSVRPDNFGVFAAGLSKLIAVSSVVNVFWDGFIVLKFLFKKQLTLKSRIIKFVTFFVN